MPRGGRAASTATLKADPLACFLSCLLSTRTYPLRGAGLTAKAWRSGTLTQLQNTQTGEAMDKQTHNDPHGQAHGSKRYTEHASEPRQNLGVGAGSQVGGRI